MRQNIDFVSWWPPAYAFLLADPAAWAGGGLLACPADGGASLTFSATAAAALEAAPLRAGLSLLYVGVHVLAVLLLRFWPHVEILPLSAFPMFGAPQVQALELPCMWLDRPRTAPGLR